MKLAFDRAASARSFDDNGFMRVAGSHITKATVNPYYSREIPGWREAGLDPERVYYGLRDPRELQKSIGTWEGLPLHIEHHPDSADDPEIRTRVGAVGRARWANPYVDAPLYIWNQAAIDAIEDGSFRELSCAYRYTPDFTPDKYEGVNYDFVMRNIRGNHVALVEEGRAGADVLVADQALDGKEDQEWRTTENGKKYEIDTKTGEVTKGNIGQKKRLERIDPIKLESTAPDMERYWELLNKNEGNFQKAAHEYFNEKLKGRYIEAQTKDGPIKAEFTGGTWQELKRGLNKNSIKAELIPYMPDIILTGEYIAHEPYKERNDSATEFHYYKKTVETSKGPKSAIVDIIVRSTALPKESVYSLTHEGLKGYQTKSDKLGKDNAAIVMSSGLSLITHNNGIRYNIIPQYEVVNIRFTDEAPNSVTKDARPKPDKGGFMKGIKKGLKKLFKGGQDSNPEVEREEVDLAQAIIDLHKVNPQTGEIVDITEDEDKAGEIRKIIGEISGKLEPDELKKLTDALGDLAYSKATGDSDPVKSGGMDEDMKSAMDKCGLDSDDEDMGKAFAEGVRYGESLEKDPAEREKLDREHESNGLKKAMDSCGLDAENPQESKAFAEGVKYGEKLERNPEERKKLDSEHESEGAKKALDAGNSTEISAILESIPNLTDEQRKPLESALLALFQNRTGENRMQAQDHALPRAKTPQPRPLLATDAAIIQARAVAAAQDTRTAPIIWNILAKGVEYDPVHQPA